MKIRSHTMPRSCANMTRLVASLSAEDVVPHGRFRIPFLALFAALAHHALVCPAQTYDVLSREVSVFNFGQPATCSEAVSREFSVFNFGQPETRAEAISREVSVFNFGQQPTRFEAIAREISVF